MNDIIEQMRNGKAKLMDFAGTSENATLVYVVLPYIEIISLEDLLSRYAKLDQENVPVPELYLVSVDGHSILSRYTYKDVTGVFNGKFVYATYIESMCVALVPADIIITRYMRCDKNGKITTDTNNDSSLWDLPRVETKVCPAPVGDIIAAVIAEQTYFEET